AKRAAARRHKHESQANPTPPRDPALSAAWQELQVLLDEEIDRLPETLRTPFISCCLENKSCAEAARQLGVKESTVCMRLSRARRLLQGRLARRGVALTTVLATVGLAQGTLAAVPPSLVGSTGKAATHVASGRVLTAGLVPAEVISLVEGANKAMFLTKAKVATAVLLVVSLLAAGTGIPSHQVLAAKHANTQPSKRSGPSVKVPGQTVPGDEGKSAAEAAKGDQEDRVSVKGQVLDPDGKPFAGAKLYLGHYGPGDKVAFSVRATSGKEGRF